MGVSAYSGIYVSVCTCVSLFIQRSADSGKCVALNESHART